MHTDSTLNSLKRQRSRAVCGLVGYFLWAVPSLVYFTAMCGAASDARVLNVFFLVLALVVLGAVHLSNKVDATNAKLKQYHRQRGFRLEDKYPPKLSELEF